MLMNKINDITVLRNELEIDSATFQPKVKFTIEGSLPLEKGK